MLLEEGHDPFVQVIQAAHPVSHPLRMVGSHHAAPKKFLECVKQLDVSLVLDNCELRQDLKSQTHFWMRIDANEETSFAVNEAHHPLRFQFVRSRPNVKSLRVLHDWSLPCGLSPCPLDFDCPDYRDEYQTAV